MLSPPVRFDGPAASRFTIVLAHGAGAPMDSPFMNAIADGLAERSLRVARFEFPYMQARRETGKRRPPDRMAVLMESWREVAGGIGGGLVIGGKSMGGRVASLIADELGARGLVCLGYPFHAPGKAPGERIAHLADLRTPTLIVQGTRDPFGAPDEVAAYALSLAIRLAWIDDGDHSLKPRKKSGRSEADTLAEAVAAIVDFVEGL